MTGIKLYADKMLQVSIEDLVNTLKGKFILEFSDGVEIETTANAVVYSAHAWMLLKEFGIGEVPSTVFISNYTNNGYIDSASHRKLFAAARIFVIEKLNIRDINIIDRINNRVYELSNSLYNTIVALTGDKLFSLDIIDYLELSRHKDIEPVITNVPRTAQAVRDAYKVINKVINTDPTISDNNITVAVRTGMANKGQVLQTIGPRGIMTELDSQIIPLAVNRSYAQGMRDIYNLAVEARSGSKALYMSESPLQDAEYFNRRLQLLCMTVERVHHFTDCGTNKFTYWNLRGPIHDDKGNLVQKSDLDNMLGVYFFDEDVGKYRPLTKSDTHLYGKTIKIRTPLNCEHPDKHGICHVCFGELAMNITASTNVGEYSATHLAMKVTQSVLSTKHLDTSADRDRISLNDEQAKYLGTNRKGNGYTLRRDLFNKNRYKEIKIYIPQANVIGMTDIFLVDDPEEINPNRISRVEYIILGLVKDDKEERIMLPVMYHKRYGMLSIDLIKHIREYGYIPTNNNMFEINMDNWNPTKTIIDLPEMTYNYSAHGAEVAATIENALNTIGSNRDEVNPNRVLSVLFELVNTKHNVNMSMLGTIVYAVTVCSRETDDYRLSRGCKKPTLADGDKINLNRNIAAAYAFEKQPKTLNNPKSFYKTGKSDHPFDVLVVPEILNE